MDEIIFDDNLNLDGIVDDYILGGPLPDFDLGSDQLKKKNVIQDPYSNKKK
jgi:hypothetical protein